MGIILLKTMSSAGCIVQCMRKDVKHFVRLEIISRSMVTADVFAYTPAACCVRLYNAEGYCHWLERGVDLVYFQRSPPSLCLRPTNLSPRLSSQRPHLNWQWTSSTAYRDVAPACDTSQGQTTTSTRQYKILLQTHPQRPSPTPPPTRSKLRILFEFHQQKGKGHPLDASLPAIDPRPTTLNLEPRTSNLDSLEPRIATPRLTIVPLPIRITVAITS